MSLEGQCLNILCLVPLLKITGAGFFKISQSEIVVVVLFLFLHLHPLLFYSFAKSFQGGQEPCTQRCLHPAELEPIPPRNIYNCCKEVIVISPVVVGSLCIRQIVNWSMNVQETFLRAGLTFPFLLSSGFVFLPVINAKNIPSGKSGIQKSLLSPPFSCLECFNQRVMIKLCLLANPKY